MNSFKEQLRKSLSDLDEQGLIRDRRSIQLLDQGRCLLKGRELWNFSSNDYLGLAGHAEMKQAAIDAIQSHGQGARASALVTGRTQWHEQLENRISQFKQTEATLLFPTGFAANVGAVTALAGNDDVVICDRLNHASLIDGCRGSKARFQVYTHASAASCESVLKKCSEYRRRIIVTDSVFSMDGDHAPLAELAKLAELYDAIVIVDEAHATGVFGEHGRGLLELQNVDTERFVTVGTLSKAIGLQGGFVTGNQVLIDWLWNTARTQMFSTALSIGVCAAATAAFDIIEQEPARRVWIVEQSAQVIAALRNQGWSIPDGTIGPIIPILIGDEREALNLSEELQQQGVLAVAIRPPTVPAGTSRLRISLSYEHGEAGIAALISSLEMIAKHRFGAR